VSSLDLNSQLHAILFVATEPLSAEHLAEAVEANIEAVAKALTELTTSLQQTGVRLSHLDGKYRLVTAPNTAATVRRFLQAESKAELSRPALETLAIIAYRGPLTKAGIERIRGVASDTIVRNLLGRGLILEAGKSSEPGRPQLYAVSHTFLQHFGLTDPSELPPLAEEQHAD
jgi:segregation and condensation protein B